MSVLPLVFPSNISCFSRGSYKVILHCIVIAQILLSVQIVTGPYVMFHVSRVTRNMFQEELARTRELPVPPQPRRSGVLARSDDNLAGDTRATLLYKQHHVTLHKLIVYVNVASKSGQKEKTKKL